MMENTQFKIFLGLELQKNAGTTLNQEITKLTKNGINLKVGLDQDSLKYLLSAINGVTQQLQKMSSLGGQAGKSVAQGFRQASKETAEQLVRLREITQEYKNGERSAEEYANKIKGMIFKKDGSLSAPAMKVPVEEMTEYISLLKQIEGGKAIQPIGKLVSTTDVETVKMGMTELVRRVETYSDKMGTVQTITSLVGKETGELIVSYQTLTTNQEKGVKAIESQKASLERLKNTVDKISGTTIDFVKGGNTTSADNDMINNANQIKKEYQEIKALSEQGVVVDDSRIAKLKTLIAEQQTLISIKEREVSKDKTLEESLYKRDRLTKQMQNLVSTNNTKYSTGVDDKESQEIQKLIQTYGKLDVAKNNMKIKTQELKDAVTAYVNSVKETATEEQKQFVATEKHAMSVEKLKNAYKNTNTKYAIGVDVGKSTAMEDQIKAFEQLDPRAKDYAITLQQIAMRMVEYTATTKENANTLNTQYANLAKLKSIQESLKDTMKNTTGFFDQDKAKALQDTINQMTQMVASGQDVSNIIKILDVNVKSFAKNSNEAMKSSAKTLKEEQQLYAYKEKMLVNLNLLEQKFSSKGMDTTKLQQTRAELQSLTVGTNNLKGKVIELDVAYKQLSGEYQMKKIGTSMKSMLGMATGFYGLYSVFGYLRQGMSSIIQETTSLEDAMIGLHRVTDETNASYDSFRKTAFATANEIGGTAKGIVDSASEFSKLGYEFSEAKKLAIDATKYSTAGEVSLTEATDALSASYTVFGNTIDETMGRLVDSTAIIDLYNKIGNTMAVTSGDIGEAMKASANSLAVANNSLSESVALIATANKTVQDASKVGNALRTIAMRIRGVKDDAGELVPKMREIVQSATNGKVDIMDGSNFKSTYQVMLEISKVWDELTDKQKAYLAETVAGKNRAEVFTAIMGNSEDLTYAMEMAKDSIGSVDEEMAVVMQSFEKRVEVMKNAWASLANTTLSSGVASAFVDGVTAVIQFIDACGGLVPILTVVVGLLVMVKAEAVSTFGAGVIKSIGSMGNALVGLCAGIKRVSTAMIQAKLHGATFAQSIQAGGVALTRMAGFASMAVTGIGAVVTAVSVGVMAYNNWKKSNEEAHQKQLESAKSLQEQAVSIDSLAQEYKKASAITDDTVKKSELAKVQKTLIDTFGEEAKGIDLVNGEYQKQIDLLHELKNKKATDSLRALDKERNDKQATVDKLLKDQDFYTRTGTWNIFTDYTEQYRKAVEEVNKAMGKEVASVDWNGWLHFDVDNAEEYKEAIDKVLSSLQNQGVYEGVRYESLTKYYNKLEEAINNANTADSDYFKSLYTIDSTNIANKLGIKNLDSMTLKQIEDFSRELKILISDPGIENGYEEYIQNIIEALKKASKEASATQSDLGVSFEPLDSIGVVAEQVYENMDILKVATDELNKTNNISDTTMKKLLQKYPQLADQMRDVASAKQALNKKMKEQAFDDATDKVADLTSVLEDLEAGNGLTASSFKKLSENFPELLGYMNDEATLIQESKNKMQELKDAQNNAYYEMLANTDSYYTNVMLADEKWANSVQTNVGKLFNDLGLKYNDDVKNYRNMEEAKAGITQGLINSLGTSWGNYFSQMSGAMSAGSTFEDYLKTQGDYEHMSIGKIQQLEEYWKKTKEFQDGLKSAFDGFTFTPVEVTVGGSKGSSSGSGSGSKTKDSYIASIFQDIVDDILKGGEEIEKAMEETQAKLDNAILIGDTELQDQLTAKLANLRVKLRDEQTNMVKQLESQMSQMAKILSDSGLFKKYDITKLTAKDLAEVTQNLEKQINSANLAGNDDLVDKLNKQKSLVQDIGSVYIDTIEKRDDVSIEYYKKENERLEAYAENLEKTYEKIYNSLDREDKVLELRKSMLLEDGGEYDKEQKEADKIFEINKKLLSNIAKRRALCESQIAQLRAKGFNEESKEIQDLIDKWLEYEQARIDIVKEIAETRRQNAIDSAQNELDDITESKDYIKDLLSLTMEMLKKETEAKKDALKEQTDAKKEALKDEYEAEKKALQDKLDLLKKEADARKDALDKEKDEKDYQDSINEKQKEIATIRNQILELSNDDSASSVKKRKELEEQLAKQLKELEDLQYERSIELQKQSIDEELQLQEDKINSELEKLEEQYNEEVELIQEKYDAQLKEYEDYLKDQVKLKEEASKLIESRDKAFYERLKKYALEYTDTTRAEFEDCWNKAYEALDKYGDKQLSVIDVIEQMTQRVIDLNAELKKLNDTTYKDFIQDDSSTSSDDFEFAGDKNNSTSSDKKVDEERDKIVQQMNNNSSKWFSASDEEKKRLAEENKKLASQIGAWQANKDGDGYKQGDWLVMINKKIVPVKNAYGVRHTGLETGEVGAPFGKFKLKANEELNKLQNGEIVVNGEQSKRIMDNVKKIYDGSQGNGGISVVLDMHDFSITEDALPKFEKLLKDRVPKIINESLFSRGIK